MSASGFATNVVLHQGAVVIPAPVVPTQTPNPTQQVNNYNFFTAFLAEIKVQIYTYVVRSSTGYVAFEQQPGYGGAQGAQRYVLRELNLLEMGGQEDGLDDHSFGPTCSLAFLRTNKQMYNEAKNAFWKVNTLYITTSSRNAAYHMPTSMRNQVQSVILEADPLNNSAYIRPILTDFMRMAVGGSLSKITLAPLELPLQNQRLRAEGIAENPRLDDHEGLSSILQVLTYILHPFLVLTRANMVVDLHLGWNHETDAEQRARVDMWGGSQVLVALRNSLHEFYMDMDMDVILCIDGQEYQGDHESDPDTESFLPFELAQGPEAVTDVVEVSQSVIDEAVAGFPQYEEFPDLDVDVELESLEDFEFGDEVESGEDTESDSDIEVD